MTRQEFTISQLAARVGLSRATLLYYEKLGLLRGRRQANGYRVYSDADLQRLQMLQRLQAGGLTLKECQSCLDGQIDRKMLANRMAELEAAITAKTQARDLLAALLGKGSLTAFHRDIERVAPDQHRDWLRTQGFTRSEAGHVALLSRDMNDHAAYMRDFMAVFAGLERWGAGSAHMTRKALGRVPFAPRHLLEIGCGTGVATLELAAASGAHITATDTDATALDLLRAKVAAAGLAARVTAIEADMADLPTPDIPYDVIWAEGSAYILGVARAMTVWRGLLRAGGVLVLSDMVWRSDSPDPAIRAFWEGEYPDMATVSQREAQARAAGYRVLSGFDMGQEALDAYYGPLAARLAALGPSLATSRVVDDLEAELAVWRTGRGQFGYHMLILQRL